MLATANKSHWRRVSLGECAAINESTYSPKEAWPFINYLDTGNITENRVDGFHHLVVGKDKVPSRARRKARPGDIVYSTVRPNQKHFGLLKEIPDRFLASTGFAVIRGIDGIADSEYIYYFLAQDHIVDYLHAIAEDSTSAYPSIRPADIARLELDLPPIAEQRAIAHILGTLDDKIELNRRMNQTLEEMARALFKSWFVDFDPVRAKAALKQRDLESHAGTYTEPNRNGEAPACEWTVERARDYLDAMEPRIVDLFPERLVDTESGEIPERWELKTLGELVELAYGKALKASNRKDGPVPVYGSNGQVGWHSERLVDGPGIIVGRKGNPGVVTWAHVGFFPIDTTFYVVPRDEYRGLPFLFFALSTQNLATVSADSAVPGLNRNLAYLNRQLVADSPVIHTFNDYASTILSRCHSLEVESRSLASQRDVLLPTMLATTIPAYGNQASRYGGNG